MSQIKEHIYIDSANDNDDDFDYDFTLDELNELSKKTIEHAVSSIDQALNMANLAPEDIDLIILAGGSSQLPLVSKTIKEKYNIQPYEIASNLMLAVSYGAALYQKELANYPQLQEGIKVLGYNLGINLTENNRLIPQLVINSNDSLPRTFEHTYNIDSSAQRLIIELVSMERGNSSSRSRVVAHREIDLPRNHSTKITVSITVNVNKLIELQAYDTKTRQIIAELTVDKELTEKNKNAIRGQLGLSPLASGVPYSNAEQPYIGIDLGTTTSEISYVNRSGDSTPKYIQNSDTLPAEYSDFCFPSVVYFEDGKQTIQVANKRACDALTDYSKRKLVFTEYKIEEIRKSLGTIDDSHITVKELSTIALDKIWKTAQKAFPNIHLKKAVVTVPASFDIDQCQMVYDAAKYAGIEEVKLIDEPTAAFLYYKHEQELDTDTIHNVLVFDFGGGTTDVTILNVQAKPSNGSTIKDEYFECLGTGGEKNCGGKSIDEEIYNYFCKKFENDTSEKISKMSGKILRSEVEKLKVKLSENYRAYGDDYDD